MNSLFLFLFHYVDMRFFYSNYYEIKWVFMLFLTINMAIMKLFTSMTCCCSSLSNYLTFLSIWLFSSYFLASTGQQITPIFRERCLRQRVDSSPSSSPHFLQLFRTVPLQNRHPMTAEWSYLGTCFQTNLRILGCLRMFCFDISIPSVDRRVCKACAVWLNAILEVILDVFGFP